jgi:hypothetical protein
MTAMEPGGLPVTFEAVVARKVRSIERELG